MNHFRKTWCEGSLMRKEITIIGGSTGYKTIEEKAKKQTHAHLSSGKCV